jgi:hypothetical protein
MGYNTSVLILNDALGTIADDPLFGKRLVDAIHAVQHGETVEVPAVSTDGRCSCSAATVIETHHADGTSVVAFGGNYGQVITNVYYSEGELPLRVLKQLADELGYDIKKRKKT